MKEYCIPHQPKCSRCSQVPQPPDRGTNHLSESTHGPDSGSKSRCEPIPWDMVFENGGTCIDLNPKKWSNPAWTLTSTIVRLWLGAQISMVNWIIAFRLELEMESVTGWTFPPNSRRSLKSCRLNLHSSTQPGQVWNFDGSFFIQWPTWKHQSLGQFWVRLERVSTLQPNPRACQSV